MEITAEKQEQEPRQQPLYQATIEDDAEDSTAEKEVEHQSGSSKPSLTARPPSLQSHGYTPHHRLETQLYALAMHYSSLTSTPCSSPGLAFYPAALNNQKAWRQQGGDDYHSSYENSQALGFIPTKAVSPPFYGFALRGSICAFFSRIACGEGSTKSICLQRFLTYMHLQALSQLFRAQHPYHLAVAPLLSPLQYHNRCHEALS